MSTTALEWGNNIDYVLTELVLFGLNIAVLLTVTILSTAVVLSHLKKGKSFFTTLRPLLELILSSSIGFVPAKGYAGEGKIDVVFVGFQENSGEDWERFTLERGGRKLSLVRIWVRVYFIILCGLIVMWAIAAFSHSLLYEKTSHCADIEVEDTDLSCFQLSNKDVPEELQQIIDEEEGNLVPCGKIEVFLRTNNISYDLEVICYEYHPEFLQALGISYGVLKTVSFVIAAILTAMLTVTNKWCNHKKDKVCCCGKLSTKAIFVFQLSLTLSAVLVVAVICTVVGVVHQLPSTRNSSFDYLRGETFHSYTTILFGTFTIFYTIGLFPWWAFKPLEEPPCWDTTNLSKQEISERLNYTIHYVVLHERFSTDYIFKAGYVVSNTEECVEQNTDNNQDEGSLSTAATPAAETAL